MDCCPAINFNSISFRSSASCGYCQGRKSSRLWVTSGFQSPKMTTEAYQLLMDRGWRRCGLYYYIPHLFESCCQAYTIRLDTYKYLLKKTQQKVLRKICHIEPIKIDSESIAEKTELEDDQSSNKLIKLLLGLKSLHVDLQPFVKDLQITQTNKQFQLKNVKIPKLFNDINKSIKEITNKFCQNLIQNVDQLILTIGSVYGDKIAQIRNRVTQFIVDVENHSKLYEGKNCCLSSNLTALLYAHLYQYWLNELHVKLPIIYHNDAIVLFQKIFDVQQQGCEIQVKITKSNQLIFSSPSITKHKIVKLGLFRCILDCQKKNVWKQKTTLKTQIESLMNPNQNFKVEIQSPIKIEWVVAQFEEDSFSLYSNYQKIIHCKENCSQESYLSFLCQPALKEKKMVAEDGTELNCGQWHMKYFLDGQLIAVGVVDILPQSLSSVYFFYDPNYRKYSLGVFGALKELEFIQQKQKSFPYFQYYYLGFYIQDSQKMVYKGDYVRSDLLCPITLEWVPLTQALRKQLEKIQETMRSSPQIPMELKMLKEGAKEQEISSPEEIEEFIKSKVNLLVCQKVIKITALTKKFSNYMLTLFQQLVPLMGKDLVQSFIFKYNRG